MVMIEFDLAEILAMRDLARNSPLSSLREKMDRAYDIYQKNGTGVVFFNTETAGSLNDDALAECQG